MISSLFNCRYDGHWTAKPLKPMFMDLLPFHYMFVFIVALLFVVMAVFGPIQDAFQNIFNLTCAYALLVAAWILWNRWRYVLSEEGVKQREVTLERNADIINHHASKWYSRYVFAAFLIWVGIWLWDAKGDNWIMRIVSFVYFGWALYVAREIGLLVLAAIGIALILWFFSALPPIPTAIIVGALIIAGAIRDRR
jgi:hypothetical protein